MPREVTLLLLVALSHVVEHCGADYNGQCKSNGPLKPRPHIVSILEFGAVGDGKALNTVAFQNAIFYLKSFTDKGGAQLYVPPGKWLTGSFNLTSHLTLFLEKDAIILGSQNQVFKNNIRHQFKRCLGMFGSSLRSCSGGKRFCIDKTLLNADECMQNKCGLQDSTKNRDIAHWGVVDALPSYGRVDEHEPDVLHERL